MVENEVVAVTVASIIATVVIVAIVLVSVVIVAVVSDFNDAIVIVDVSRRVSSRIVSDANPTLTPCVRRWRRGHPGQRRRGRPGQMRLRR